MAGRSGEDGRDGGHRGNGGLLVIPYLALIAPQTSGPRGNWADREEWEDREDRWGVKSSVISPAGIRPVALGSQSAGYSAQWVAPH